MTIENRLSINELGNIGGLEDKFRVRVRFREISPSETTLETTVYESFNRAIKRTGIIAKTGLAVTGMLGLATVASVALPLIFMEDQYISKRIALFGGGMLGCITAAIGTIDYALFKTYHFNQSQRRKAEKMIGEGYVLARQLDDQILIPSAVGDAANVSAMYSLLGLSFSPIWYIVKEQYVSAPVIPLSKVGNYVGETVVLPVQITAVGNYSDMKLSATGKFSGTLMGAFPLQMTGTIDGRVFTEDVSFRIGDSEGNSIPACLGYLAPHLKEQLPLELRGYSPVTGNVNVADKTQLVIFLSEAQQNKRELILLGKLDNAGNFNMEAIADPGTKQAYALAVYQPR